MVTTNVYIMKLECSNKDDSLLGIPSFFLICELFPDQYKFSFS